MSHTFFCFNEFLKNFSGWFSYFSHDLNIPSSNESPNINFYLFKREKKHKSKFLLFLKQLNYLCELDDRLVIKFRQ
jgi:hypothetical protein